MCIEYSSRVSEEPFEVSGSTPNPDTQAATRGRSNEEHQVFLACNQMCHIFRIPAQTFVKNLR